MLSLLLVGKKGRDAQLSANKCDCALLSAAGVAKPLYQKSLLEAVVIYILL